MPFPDAPRVIFRQNPLAEVICQFRFPPILSIAAEPPSAFQDRVRDSYPLYAREDLGAALPTEIASLFAQVGGQFAQPDAGAHRFISAEDESRVISLNRDFVAISDGSYRRWEEFRQTVHLAEATLREVYRPAFYTRVGLRYRNVISREALSLQDVAWDHLISPPFVGMLGSNEVRDDVEQTRSDTLIRLTSLEGGHVRVRHGLARVTPDQPPAYTIDADFFRQGRCTSDVAFESLVAFNRLARNLFRWAITPALETALGPEPEG